MFIEGIYSTLYPILLLHGLGQLHSMLFHLHEITHITLFFVCILLEQYNTQVLIYFNLFRFPSIMPKPSCIKIIAVATKV